MLLHCIDGSMTFDIGVPLERLSYSQRINDDATQIIRISDSSGNNIIYTFDRFIQMIDSKGLDGFAF